MKKVLICFVLGFVFVTIGITSCVFEIRNYEYEDGAEVYYKMLTGKGTREEKIELKGKPLVISYQDENVHYCTNYSIHEDAKLQDTVILKVAPNVVYEIKDNEIIMKGIKEEYEYDYNPFLSLNVIIDGLKQHKIYNLSNVRHIQIHCSQKEMDNIQFQTPDLE